MGNHHSRTTVHIMKNDLKIALVQADGMKHGSCCDTQGSASVVMQLATGDEVWVKFDEKAYFIREIIFMGVLVASI